MAAEDSGGTTALCELETVVDWASPVIMNGNGCRGGVGIRIYVSIPDEVVSGESIDTDGANCDDIFSANTEHKFLLQLHTPESYKASLGLNSCWAEYSSANTKKQRARALKRANELVER